MNRTILGEPPNPADARYVGNPGKWMMDTYQWMLTTKQRLEGDSTVNTRPVAPFVIGTYTAINTFSPAGTDTTGNFLATLVTALQVKGITATRSSQ